MLRSFVVCVGFSTAYGFGTILPSCEAAAATMRTECNLNDDYTLTEDVPYNSPEANKFCHDEHACARAVTQVATVCMLEDAAAASFASGFQAQFCSDCVTSARSVVATCELDLNYRLKEPVADWLTPRFCAGTNCHEKLQAMKDSCPAEGISEPLHDAAVALETFYCSSCVNGLRGARSSCDMAFAAVLGSEEPLSDAQNTTLCSGECAEHVQNVVTECAGHEYYDGFSRISAYNRDLAGCGTCSDLITNAQTSCNVSSTLEPPSSEEEPLEIANYYRSGIFCAPKCVEDILNVSACNPDFGWLTDMFITYPAEFCDKCNGPWKAFETSCRVTFATEAPAVPVFGVGVDPCSGECYNAMASMIDNCDADDDLSSQFHTAGLFVLASCEAGSAADVPF